MDRLRQAMDRLLQTLDRPFRLWANRERRRRRSPRPPRLSANQERRPSLVHQWEASVVPRPRCTTGQSTVEDRPLRRPDRQDSGDTLSR